MIVAFGHGQQIGGGDVHVVALRSIWLGVGMRSSKTSSRERHQARMRHPGAVVAIA